MDELKRLKKGELMLGKTVTLPKKDEMLRRLLLVNNNSHLQQKFYPLLLEQAGVEKVALGVVMLLQLAIFDYTKGLPAVIGGTLNMQMPNFIDALCPDEEVAEEARTLLEEAMMAEQDTV